MTLQATNESLAAENAQLQLQIERIRQETIEECLKVIEGERLYDNTGEPEDIGYAAAIDDVIAAIRLQGAGQPQHLPVQAEQQEQSVHQDGGKPDGADAHSEHGSVPMPAPNMADEEIRGNVREALIAGHLLKDPPSA